MLHSRFPPASAYRLNRCLFALKSDDAFRSRFRADARAAMREMELDDADAAALLRGQRDALVARGAHPYLVFMPDPRLRMALEAETVEYFQPRPGLGSRGGDARGRDFEPERRGQGALQAQQLWPLG